MANLLGWGEMKTVKGRYVHTKKTKELYIAGARNLHAAIRSMKEGEAHKIMGWAGLLGWIYEDDRRIVDRVHLGTGYAVFNHDAGVGRDAKTYASLLKKGDPIGFELLAELAVHYVEEEETEEYNARARLLAEALIEII